MNEIPKVGTIVRVNSSFLNEPAGVLAFVYENYSIGDKYPGCSLITQNGVNLGGFGISRPINEVEQYLEFVRDTGYQYEFKNVFQLDKDFKTIIKPLFNK